ncbi:hypothetical protein KUCAC02_025633, partial [Chaenocephalus aceratus]
VDCRMNSIKSFQRPKVKHHLAQTSENVHKDTLVSQDSASLSPVQTTDVWPCDICVTIDSCPLRSVEVSLQQSSQLPQFHTLFISHLTHFLPFSPTPQSSLHPSIYIFIPWHLSVDRPSGSCLLGQLAGEFGLESVGFGRQGISKVSCLCLST